jgi:hypothetical protein
VDLPVRRDVGSGGAMVAIPTDTHPFPHEDRHNQTPFLTLWPPVQLHYMTPIVSFVILPRWLGTIARIHGTNVDVDSAEIDSRAKITH